MSDKQKRYYKTTIVVEVLSDEPIPEGIDLYDIMEEAEDGAYSGVVKSVAAEEVDAPTIKQLLAEQGSDPDFFEWLEEDVDKDAALEELSSAELKNLYERLSGNKVSSKNRIYDSSGRYIDNFSRDMAKEYILTSEEVAEELGNADNEVEE